MLMKTDDVLAVIIARVLRNLAGILEAIRWHHKQMIMLKNVMRR